MLATKSVAQRRVLVLMVAAVCAGLPAIGCGGNDSSATAKSEKTAGSVDQATTGSSDPMRPIVELRTNFGPLKFQLDAVAAPETVRNFLDYVNHGHYDGTIFHQVEKDYALLGGGYTVDLREKTGRYGIANEAKNGLLNRRGTIAMARFLDVVDSATCQFIINLVDNPALDHHGDKPEEFGFAVFGQLVDGQTTLDRIAAVPVSDSDQFPRLPRQAVVIETARQLR